MSISAGAVIVTPDSARTLVDTTFAGPLAGEVHADSDDDRQSSHQRPRFPRADPRPWLSGDDEVVGPFERSVERHSIVRELRAQRAPRRRRRAGADPVRRWGATGSNKVRTRREATPSVRSSRPRPALWKSATATRPSGAPSSERVRPPRCWWSRPRRSARYARRLNSQGNSRVSWASGRK
jgi:hypothetical protein